MKALFSIKKICKYDEKLYTFLEKHVYELPIRIVKLVANYYTDARIRKIYWNRLGIVMGKNTYANLGLKIASNDYERRVIIGDNVSIAPNVLFVVAATANNGNEINDMPYVRDHLTVTKNICVEDEAWICANVTILPGVTIGRCSVIGAGSVVIDNVEPYSIYAGVPARKIRDLKSGERV